MRIFNSVAGLKRLPAVGKCFCLFLVLAVATETTMAASHTETEELRQLARQLQQQLEALQERIISIEKNVSENARAVEATAEAIEEQPESALDRLSIGGYGELHYNNLDAKDSANDKDEIDFHRFVLFFGYQFTDKLKLFSEIEIEHALVGDGAPGEVELEQAFVEYSFDDNHAARVGLFLLPVGILNETHEPPTFYGVERNNVENIIVPSTWWAGGIGYTFKHENGFQFDAALHEGLDVPDRGSSAARIRSGRQKTANANADSLAGTGRIKYTGYPGLELAATLQYQSDLSQDADDHGLDDAMLYQFHAIYNTGPFGFRALYAEWDLDTVDRDIMDADGNTINPGADIKREGKDDQHGWYIEPSYRLNDYLGLFVRYEDVEGARNQDQFNQWTLGANWWIHENVVLKADYLTRDYDHDAGSNIDDGFNLGFGFYF